MGSNCCLQRTRATGRGKDCGATKTFTFPPGQKFTGRYWRWEIVQSHDGTSTNDAPTIHWLQLGNVTGWHHMADMVVTGKSFPNGPVANLLKVNSSGFWNAGGDSAPWSVVIDSKQQLAVSRFRYSICE